MEDDYIVKEEITNKLKIVYALFFGAIFAFFVTFFIFEALSSDSGLLNKITIIFPIGLFIAAGVLSALNHSKQERDWANSHFLWLRDTFVIMSIVILISRIPNIIIFFIKSSGPNNPIFSISFYLGVLLIFFMVWFLYRVIFGFVRFLLEKSPYSIARDIRRILTKKEQEEMDE